MQSNSLEQADFLLNSQVSYCWNDLGNALFYAFSPIIFFGGLSLILLPSMIGMSNVFKPLVNSHLWHIMEELTFQAFLLQYLVVIWFFSSREQNTLLSQGYIFSVCISSCILSYLLAIPFYVMVERPFKNFLDLILFPKSSIFKKQKDLDDDDEKSSDSSDDDKSKHKKAKCGYCQDDEDLLRECECMCLVNKTKCKCIDKLVEKDHSFHIKKDEQKVIENTLQNQESIVSQPNRSNFQSEVKSTAGALTRSELEKKRVSFDINNIKY